jgi:PAT family beta-lactamase induction signal transducer AmpG
MVKPFWVDQGMTPTEIGAISSTVGMALTIFGALLGGWFIQRRGVYAGLLWMGIAQLISNFGYVVVAVLDLPMGTSTLFGLSFGPFQASIYAASMIESLAQGLGTAAFLSFPMNLCDRRHAATQYALLSAAFSLSRDVAGAFSGIGVEALGYPVYFTVTALLALPGMALLPWIKGRIHEGPEEP